MLLNDEQAPCLLATLLELRQVVASIAGRQSKPNFKRSRARRHGEQP